MMLSNTIFPLVLLNNKLGHKLGVVLAIALLMNFGWIMESVVIQLTNTHRCLGAVSYSTVWSSNGTLINALKGIIGGAFALIIENGIRKLKRT